MCPTEPPPSSIRRRWCSCRSQGPFRLRPGPKVRSASGRTRLLLCPQPSGQFRSGTPRGAARTDAPRRNFFPSACSRSTRALRPFLHSSWGRAAYGQRRDRSLFACTHRATAARDLSPRRIAHDQARPPSSVRPPNLRATIPYACCGPASPVWRFRCGDQSNGQIDNQSCATFRQCSWTTKPARPFLGTRAEQRSPRGRCPAHSADEPRPSSPEGRG
jgi:hypothetical protein